MTEHLHTIDEDWDKVDVRVSLYSYHFSFIPYDHYTLSIPFLFLSLDLLTLIT